MALISAGFGSLTRLRIVIAVYASAKVILIGIDRIIVLYALEYPSGSQVEQ